MLLYQIALTLVPGVGDILGKKLVSYCGSAEAVFREPARLLRKIPRVSETLLEALSQKDIFARAEREMAFIQRYQIEPIFFLDKDYPARLKNCIDGPLLLYYKGNADLNARKIIGIVGTRSATEYGKDACRQLIEGLSDLHPLTVSGLAYGIDSCAHRISLEMDLDTVGVLGHGLDRIYPYLHKSLAEKMLKQGGLLTDFMSETKPDRENFPKRNRIIAGLCDAIVVIEAARSGGALITADIANSYNRDVFAIPGRITDPYSEGANLLIRSNKAALITSASDLSYMMGWLKDDHHPVRHQRKLFIEMTADEEIIVEILSGSGKSGIDELTFRAGISMSRVSAALLNLEFEGIVKCLPGKEYLLNG